jgi:hypothetical protein
LKRQISESISQFDIPSVPDTEINSGNPSGNKTNNRQYSSDTGSEEESESRNQEITPVRQSSVYSYLSNSECPLPLFDKHPDNSVFHLKQLDDYMRLKQLPEASKLLKELEHVYIIVPLTSKCVNRVWKISYVWHV